jgi:NAD(P)-dependent dehydrogenase (short-subunit alcohol dehydrogenase family)
MDLHLSGKKALVTGASQGLGLAIVKTLAAEGVSSMGRQMARARCPGSVGRCGDASAHGAEKFSAVWAALQQREFGCDPSIGN